MGGHCARGHTRLRTPPGAGECVRPGLCGGAVIAPLPSQSRTPCAMGEVRWAQIQEGQPRVAPPQ